MGWCYPGYRCVMSAHMRVGMLPAPVQLHCNPARFPELLRSDGSWVFNTSIAEQTNVWLGGYHSMLREMTVDRYNFFLDELIMSKNEMTKAKLEHEGQLPSYIPGLSFSLPKDN